MSRTDIQYLIQKANDLRNEIMDLANDCLIPFEDSRCQKLRILALIIEKVSKELETIK